MKKKGLVISVTIVADTCGGAQVENLIGRTDSTTRQFSKNWANAVFDNFDILNRETPLPHHPLKQALCRYRQNGKSS